MKILRSLLFFTYIVASEACNGINVIFTDETVLPSDGGKRNLSTLQNKDCVSKTANISINILPRRRSNKVAAIDGDDALTNEDSPSTKKQGRVNAVEFICSLVELLLI